MKVPASRRSYGLSINITPLIDLVFLLNIFFLVATYFIRNEQVEAVELPTVIQGKDDTADAPGRVTVTITGGGQLTVGGVPITADEFAASLQQTIAEYGADAIEVRLRADKLAPYAEVEPLLIRCAELGVTKVRFAVLQESR